MDDKESSIVTPAEEALFQHALGNVFASERPKHALQGIGDAAWNTVAGVGLGVGALVTLPVAIGKEEGVKGVAKGLAMGVASLVGMTAYGACTGAAQLVKGVYNTGEALRETAGGSRYWNSQEGRWVDVQLATALADLPTSDADLFARARELYRGLQSDVGTHAPKEDGSAEAAAAGSENERNYYAIMGVERTATPAEIRGAFHRKALEMHPDKNPNNPEATRRFQELIEANAVLSDSERRAYYDTHGVAEVLLDENSPYSRMEEGLGAAFLECFIGRIAWALYLTPNVFINEKLSKEFQSRRTLRLAQQLLRFVDEENGVEAALPAIRDAVSTPMGQRFMPIVAHQYTVAARQHLSSNVFWRELDSFSTSKISTLSRTFKATKVGIPMAFRAKQNSLNESDVMDFIAAVSQSDVERTVLRASRFILYDTSAPPEQRKRRAENLAKLGLVVKNACQAARAEA